MTTSPRYLTKSRFTLASDIWMRRASSAYASAASGRYRVTTSTSPPPRSASPKERWKRSRATAAFTG